MAMQKEMTMPRLGESVTEGTIVEWLVNVGDQVAEYDPICEVQTVKVVAEVPASFSGTVKEILVPVDETVSVGTPIVVMETEAGAEVSDDDQTTTTPAPTKPQTPVTAATIATESTPSVATTDGPRFSPAVATLLSKYQLDPNQITGTGHQGRLTRKDVENFVAQRSQPQTPQSTPAKSVAQAKPVQSGLMGQLATDTVQPASSIRKAIADHMVQSKAEIPHGWMMVEQDVSDLVKLRQSEKAKFQQLEGYKLTYFPFFVKAVAQALVKHPRINSSWQNNQILTHHEINISIAVAKGDELYVPVIKHADNLSVKGIASEITRLANAVRTGKITADDMQGGTFTVNNTGSFGSVASMGIINYPQAAIIQIESIRKELKPTPDGLGFKIADMVNLSLSVDHRLLDGVAAGGFLKDVKANLMQFKPGFELY
ncbi:dihydrolipoamide acetyltransferase family protein [Agrilactobacillus fermenti]|uniref:dihydrolipoamide acetyltransferase family protein n=1 Tax=Agrilactobacillus fermenti TaxID=2586909 RepID=UPI003A5C0F23